MDEIHRLNLLFCPRYLVSLVTSTFIVVFAILFMILTRKKLASKLVLVPSRVDLFLLFFFTL